MVATVAVYVVLLAHEGVHPFGNSSVLTSDMNNQYVEYYGALNRVVHGHGSLLFSWQADQGMNFYPVFAYYLTSPFGVIPALVSDSRLPDAILVMTALKLATGAGCMALFLRRFRAGVPHVVSAVFATGYALMAWSLVYALNVMWLDALYLIPLVLIGIERLLERRQVFPLALALAATFVVSFYTGGMIALFAVLYWLARFAGLRADAGLREFGREAVRFGIAGLIGAAVSAVFTLPTYSGLAARPKITVSESVKVSPKTVPPLELISRLFGGTVDKTSHTPNIAVGTLVLLLVPLFFTCRSVRRAERIAFGGILAVLFLACEVEPLYLLFHDGDAPNAWPFRFAFLISTVLVLLAYRAFAEIDGKRQVLAVPALTVVWFAVLVVCRKTYGGTSDSRLFPGETTDFIAVVLLVGGAALAWALWVRVREPSAGGRGGFWFSPRLAAGLAVAVLAVDITGSALFVATKSIGKGDSETVKYSSWSSAPSKDWTATMSSLVPPSDDYYRAEGYPATPAAAKGTLAPWEHSLNDSLRLGNFAQTHFSSIADGDLHGTLRELGFSHHEGDVWASHLGATLVTDALFDDRYLVSVGRQTRLGLTPVRTGPDGTTVYQNADALPVGFRLDAASLAGMTTPLPTEQGLPGQQVPTASPFAAQEQVFGTPGLFEPECTAAPQVSGAAVTAVDAGRIAVRQLSASGDVVLNWTCTVPGDRELYLFAPGGIGQWSFDDRPYAGYATTTDDGIHDLGSVTAGGTFTLRATFPVASWKTVKARTVVLPADPLRALDPAKVSARVAQLRAGAVTDVSWSDTGLAATTVGAAPATVFLSVPAIKGWAVKVDGRTVSPAVLMGSYLGVSVPAGKHRITLDFTPPGLLAGGAVSILGIAGLAAAVVLDRRRRPTIDLDSPSEAAQPSESDPVVA